MAFPPGRAGAASSPTIRRAAKRKDRDLYVMDPADPKSDRLVIDVECTWAVLDWSPRQRDSRAPERRRLRRHTPLADRRRLREEDWSRRRLARPASWMLGQFTGWQDRLRLERSRVGHRAHLEVQSRERRLVAAAPTRRSRSKCCGVSVEQHARRVVDLGETTSCGGGRSIRQTLAPPRCLPGDFGTSPGSDRARVVGVEFAGASHVQRLYAVEATSHQVEHRGTTSEIGGANAASLPEAEPIDWKSFEPQ